MQSTHPELLQNVRDVIAKILNVPLADVPAEMAFGDIPQWDSMGHMEVMLALEENFSVPVNADTIGELVSVPLIVEYISQNTHA
ncbi:MAG: acyl carrier protein [Anaerolineae bacterium]|nr:acyl carrier protein [Anaerolineae bacterium]